MNGDSDYLQGMKRKVGWFLLLGIGVVAFTLLITGARSNFFAKKFDVYVQPPTATSFREGLPVRFQGFGIGYVDYVELLEQGEVKVTLQLLDRYRPMLHQGAIVRLAKEGLIGEQFIRISAGDKSAPVLRHQATLDFVSEASIEKILQDLQPTITQADKLLTELAELAVWVNDPYGTFHATMANMAEFSANLNSDDMQSMAKDIKNVLNEVRREQLMTNLSHAFKSTAVSLDEMKPFLSDLGKDGGESVEKLNGLLERMQLLADNLKVLSSDATELTPELPGLARELRESVSESRVLMRTIRKSWLFGDSGDEGKGQPLSNMSSPPAVDLRP